MPTFEDHVFNNATKIAEHGVRNGRYMQAKLFRDLIYSVASFMGTTVVCGFAFKRSGSNVAASKKK